MKGQHERATIISAPAGFGKTTLTLQWLEQTSLCPAWLSLEKDDSDPDRFLRYFVAAIRRCTPEFGKSISVLL
jgi:LuxR family maltose regulon positive regulatory protein